MSHIRVEATEPVARVHLARPEKRNAINTDMAAELAEAAASVAAAGICSAILGADGPVFCAGADMTDLEGGSRAVSAVVAALTSAPIHWTVVVRQPVLGAGLAVLAACPLVLATPSATFGLPELRRGFFPDELIAGQADVVGARAAFELAFSAASVSAQRAAEIRLVSAVCDDRDIDAVALERATGIAGRDRDAVLAGIGRWQRYVEDHRAL